MYVKEGIEHTRATASNVAIRFKRSIDHFRNPLILLIFSK